MCIKMRTRRQQDKFVDRDGIGFNDNFTGAACAGTEFEVDESGEEKKEVSCSNPANYKFIPPILKRG